MLTIEIDRIRQTVEGRENKDAWHVFFANLAICALALPTIDRRHIDPGKGGSFLSLLNENEVRQTFEVHDFLSAKGSEVPAIAQIMRELKLPLFRYPWFKGLFRCLFTDNKELLPRALGSMRFNYPRDLPRGELISRSLDSNFGHGSLGTIVSRLEFVGQPDGTSRIVQHFDLTPFGLQSGLVVARQLMGGRAK